MITMKKKILSLFLAVVMLSLALVGCGSFDYAEDSTQHATFKADDYLAALLAGTIEIDDGTFTADPETREQKVLDSIYNSIASKTDKTDASKLTVGKVDGHDLFYYAYYVTATVDGVEYVFTADTMAIGKAEETQFGYFFPSDLEGKIIDLYKDYEFTEETSYKSEAAVMKKLEEGQIVFVTFERSYDKGDEAGSEHKESATKHPMLYNKDNIFLTSLINKVTVKDDVETIPTTLNITKEDVRRALKATIENPTTEEIDAAFAKFGGNYTKIKVDFATNAGATEKTFKEITYTEAKSLTPTLKIGTKTTVDLKGKELTYHVFPAYYINVEDVTANDVVEVIYGKGFNASVIKNILFGHHFGEKTEDEQKAELDKFKFNVDKVDLSIDEFAAKIVDVLTKASTTKSDLTTAEKTLDEKQTAVNAAEDKLAKAKKVVEDAGDKATEAQKKAVTNAETALKTANTALDSAKTALDKAKTAKDDAKKAADEKVAQFFEVLAGQKIDKAKFLDLYKENVVYHGLMETYDTSIKNALAKKLYELITEENSKYVSYSALPEDAVKASKEHLIDNYEYCFYNDMQLGDDTDKELTDTFYNLYNHNFDEFFVKYAVPTDLNVTIKANYDTDPKAAYDEAMAAVTAAAEANVKELIAIYAVAEGLGLTVSDDEFDEYLDSEEFLQKKYIDDLLGKSKTDEAYRTAYQFDKVMDYLLDSKRVDADGKENEEGKFVKYSRVKFVFADEEEDEK